MLIQICEPGQTPMPHSEEAEIAVGIDLGTTNSLVAIVNNGRPEVIRDEAGNALHPSLVSYLQEGGVHTGHDAHKSTGTTIASIKRLMGRSAKEIKNSNISYKVIEGDGALRLDIAGRILTPVEISSEILKSLKITAENALGKKVNKAVITVPAYFDDNARTATKDAARLANIEVLRLVNEPTAAALAYGLDKGAEGIYAIYDLGGGTFDISILKMEKGVFQVLATGGSVEIGGDDFDREIAEIFLWQCRNIAGHALTPSHKEQEEIVKLARIAKEYLTDQEEFSSEIIIEGKEFPVKITFQDLERAMHPYVSATLDICEQVLSDANIAKDEIKGVVLVGGSTRARVVQQYVQDMFAKAPLKDIDPDLVVAEGAALQAEALTKGGDNLLLDVLPLSLGLETVGGIVEKIIHRNTPIPIAKAQEFTTYQDGQTAMVIHVLQGEREMVTQNRSLAKFELKGIPPMKAGIARVEVTFAVDADGLLTVSASELTTGKKQVVEVKPSYGLTEEEIKEMLYASMEHGRDDMAERLFTESKVEAESLIMAIESALKEDADLISELEIAKINEKKIRLQQSIKGTNREEILANIKDLEESAENFATERMNKYIAESLRGKKVSDT